MRSLVIVESPTKAKTIRAFLPKGYEVYASMGHVRDLPGDASEIPAKLKGTDWARLGVNVDEGFEPLYVIPSSKKRVVRELKEELKGADELILATDEDREGESISWHLLQVLNPTVPVKRMVFHEITKGAIEQALLDCREVDDGLVRAQETRRILDRLVGYTLSPLLWKKIAWGLSAGRVQSVAVRLLVLRERERRAFRAGTYWDLKAALRHQGDGFEALLIEVDGVRVATGKDFDEATGKIAAGKKVRLLDSTEAESLRSSLAALPWRVAKTEEKPSVRRPAPPFTTSTLQQESNRKLRSSARDTMRVAQNLYERGFITYMRTDSVHLSNQAISAARDAVTRLYGDAYLSPKPRNFVTKSAAAQEAHEAIRPAGERFRTPDATGLDGRELALYDLIWKRTVACQMADARQTALSVRLDVGSATFRASGKRIDFAGFLRAYVEGSDDPNAALENQEVPLPDLVVGDEPNLEGLEAVSHETQPPARYTEASLVKELENDGVGRPSTYASIIGTIIERGYVNKQGQALIPTFTAFAVTGLLERNFPHLVDLKFTAKMERTLDEISVGDAEWLPYLSEFYLGANGLRTQVQAHEATIDPAVARTIELGGVEGNIRIGRFGPYVEVERPEGLVKASLPRDAAPADLDQEMIDTLLRQKIEGPDELGRHPDTDQPIYVLTGQYGPYVQLGAITEDGPKPKRASLPKGTTPDQVTLELAVGLLSLPRHLGDHPESGAKVLAGLGRFGPYVVHDRGKQGKDYRSLKKEDNVLTVDLERALALLTQPKASRGRGQATPTRELGAHPDDGAQVGLYDGRYGPYVKHGSVSASIPKGRDPGSVTLLEAVTWIADKRPAKRTKKKATKKTSPKRAKTAAAKKSGVKKANVKKKAKKKTVKKKASTGE